MLHKVIYIRSLTLSRALVSTFTQEKPSTSQPVYIEVAGRIALPIVQAGYVNGTWLVSDTMANYVAQSATPGGSGNIIIYAHNKPTMFGPLRTLVGGEKIRIRTSDGTLYRYQVVFVREVDTRDTRLLTPTASEALTLYTCSGFLDGKRLVVRAVPLPV